VKGQIVSRALHSPALEGNPLGDPADRELLVYLPPGYDAQPRRYPVVYFLHGYTGSGPGWLRVQPFSPNTVERLDELVATGAVPPVIAAFPDGWTALGGSQWIDSEAIGRYRTYLAKDVVGFVDRSFRTVADPNARAVIGASSGGYGALVMGRDHPELFGHLAAHAPDSCFEYSLLPDLPKAAAAFLKAGSPQAWLEDFLRRARETRMRSDDHPAINAIAMCAAYAPKPGAPLNLELPFDLQTARLDERVWARIVEHDPVRFIPRAAQAFASLQTVFVDCGTRDEFNLRWGVRMIVEELRRLGVLPLHEEFEDGHTGFSSRYERSLRVLVPRMVG
jgi:pimeloyl-ACP methyl ester carboxylesterase